VATPLYRKLGIKAGHQVYVAHCPFHYTDLFDDFPEEVKIDFGPPASPVDFVHLFVESFSALEDDFATCKRSIKKDGMLWISWPKGKKNNDVNRDIIREYVLAHGLVDVKPGLCIGFS
jgi:hypothetical protein